MGPLQVVRAKVGDAIFSRVAGDEGPARRDRIHLAEGPRRVAPGSPIHVGALGRVDVRRRPARPAPAVAAPARDGGGRSALGVPRRPVAAAAAHQQFLAATTYGTDEDADRASQRRAGPRARLAASPPTDGASGPDPHLIALGPRRRVDSFLLRTTARRPAAGRCLLGTSTSRKTAHVARALGAVDVPRHRGRARPADGRLPTRARGDTRPLDGAARFILVQPPVPRRRCALRTACRPQRRSR